MSRLRFRVVLAILQDLYRRGWRIVGGGLEEYKLAILYGTSSRPCHSSAPHSFTSQSPFTLLDCNQDEGRISHLFCPSLVLRYAICSCCSISCRCREARRSWLSQRSAIRWQGQRQRHRRYDSLSQLLSSIINSPGIRWHQQGA